MAFYFKDFMRKRNLTALALAFGLVVAPAPAYAAPSLADHMNDAQGTMWNKLEAWLTAWHAEQHDEEAPAPEPAPAPTTPAPAPAPEPTTGDLTSGKGGTFTNRTFQSFTSAGLTSRYHIYAEGRTGNPGVLVYADGSGGYGFDNPNSTYLIGGANGLDAIARKHNLILVVPEAPAPGCDGSDNCWYDRDLGDAQAKAQWSNDLLTKVKGEYNIDQDRVVIGGYSSGAQWTTQTFLPAHGANQSVDLAVPIAYGGAPRGSVNAPADWKRDLVISWDTGKADPAYGTASYESVGGYNEYKRLGFNVDATWPDRVTHSRPGQFGGILDREITQHLK